MKQFLFLKLPIFKYRSILSVKVAVKRMMMTMTRLPEHWTKGSVLVLQNCYQLKSEMVLVLSQLSIECDTVDDDGAFRKTGDRGQSSCSSVPKHQLVC